ncbi:Ig-like domain-containing protein [Deinococcus aetherius]|uniref:Ig-like domain-containing protein n=1 Tax=Deinococcus aetherius TaxID=200252 RepID=UPI00222E679B|nr:Ig-like domain-containing protein [Deinococcus aetherius]
MPPAGVAAHPGLQLEAEAGAITASLTPQTVADPRAGGRIINDPDASGGQAVVLLGTNDNVEFAVPSSLQAGRYTVSVRGRGEAHEGWPIVDLNDTGQQRMAVATLDSATYVTRSFGEFDLTPGEVLNLSFINDLYGGPGQDRNAVVDYLVIEPVGTTPANRPPTVTLRPLDNGNLTGADGSTFEDEHNVLLEADASDPDGTVARVEFFAGDVKIGEDTSAPYRLVHSQERDQPLAGPTPVTYSARVTDDRGAVTTSAPVGIVTRSRGYDPASPLPLRAVNFGGPATAVSKFHCSFCLNGVFFDAGDAGGWTTNGTVQSINVAPVPPILSPEREELMRGAVSRPGGLEVGVPVPNAAYEVYLWVRSEGADPYDIQMEGRSVSRFDPREAGVWSKLGPFPVTVGDGVLNVASTGTATASFSAIEVWRVRQPGETPPSVAFNPVPEYAPYPGTALPLTVEASSASGTVEKVEFYAKGPSPSSRALKLGEDRTAPFSLAWQNAPAGYYSLIARATDSAGLSSTTETKVIIQAP